MRWNVLILVGAGYTTILLIFATLALSTTVSPEQAYEAVQSPLTALVGGTLAIAKDLID